MKSILDRSFEYRDSSKTDLRETFARVRREQEEQRAMPAVFRDRRRKVNDESVRALLVATARFGVASMKLDGTADPRDSAEIE